MCLRDLLETLRLEGLEATEPQIRWAITSSRITRPPLDGSLRFDFGQRQLDELREYLQARRRGNR
jgi:hypothetical protein